MNPLQNRNRSRSKNTDLTSEIEAYRAALLLLNRRDYTSSRLCELLSGKGFDLQPVNVAIGRLQQEGWLNDKRFAERFAESATATGRYFGQRLRQEMLRRGFATQLVYETLDALNENNNEVEDAFRLLKQKFNAFSYRNADDKEKRKIFGYLQRKGFSFSSIMSAMKQEDYS